MVNITNFWCASFQCVLQKYDKIERLTMFCFSFKYKITTKRTEKSRAHHCGRLSDEQIHTVLFSVPIVEGVEQSGKGFSYE